MKPSEQIRKIWEEMKELKRIIEIGNPHSNNFWTKRRGELEEKYENVENLFGHESTLLKAIIYYEDDKQSKK